MHAVNNVAILCISYFAPQAQVYNAATLATGLVLFAAAFAYLAFFDKSKDPAAVRFAPAQPLHGKYFFYFAAVGWCCASFPGSSRWRGEHVLKVNVVAVGKVKERYFKEGIEEYAKRISRYADFSLIEVREENFSKEGEAERRLA